MIPVVPSANISRIVFDTMLLLFENEVPLFVELYLFGLGGLCCWNRGNEFVVKMFGMLACEASIADHRLLSRFGQSAGLSHAVAFNDVLNNGDDLVFGKPSVEENGAAMLGKSLFANQTPEEPCFFILTVPGADADISCAPNAVFRALFILTTKLLQVDHDRVKMKKSLTEQRLEKQW
jgi:hypothetical protein